MTIVRSAHRFAIIVTFALTCSNSLMQSATQHMELSPLSASTLTSDFSGVSAPAEFAALLQCLSIPLTPPSRASREQRWLEPSLPKRMMVFIEERRANKEDGVSSSVIRIWNKEQIGVDTLVNL